MFSEVFIIHDSLKKSKYYAIAVKFQIRGSPHIHSFIWIMNAPKLSFENIYGYKLWVDSLVKADLPDPETDSTMLS